MKLLDLYSGAGLAAIGYQQAGFHVTGVDNEKKSCYAGDTWIEADALEVLADVKFCRQFVAIRPIIDLSAKEVFDYIAFNGHKRNPLYDQGFNRVGCFPCIMCSLGEIIRVAETEPERITAIRQVELSAGTTFFGPDKIPVRFCRNQITNDKGKLVGAPTISEVIKYAYDRRHDSGLFQGTCQNRYIACK